jgi:hypothetical protein
MTNLKSSRDPRLALVQIRREAKALLEMHIGGVINTDKLRESLIRIEDLTYCDGTIQELARKPFIAIPAGPV